MKKIYILGNFEKNGLFGNDSSDLDSYMELGWEQMTTGFWAKNNLSKDDYICTSRDRLFMYRHITKKLVPWENLNIDEYDEIYKIYEQKWDLLKKYNEEPWSEKEKNNLLKNNFLTEEIQNFVCVQVRKRDHCPWRNGDYNKWIKLINLLSEKYDKVFIVGKGNDEFKNYKKCELISLERYCSLIKSDGCVASYGSSSGCMMLNLLYGKKNLPVHLLYTENIATNQEGHILYFGNKVNVAGVDLKLYFSLEEMKNTTK